MDRLSLLPLATKYHLEKKMEWRFNANRLVGKTMCTDNVVSISNLLLTCYVNPPYENTLSKWMKVAADSSDKEPKIRLQGHNSSKRIVGRSVRIVK